MLSVYYQVWLDGKPYLKGKKFADLWGARQLYARIAGRISMREARKRLAVVSIDESGPRTTYTWANIETVA